MSEYAVEADRILTAVAPLSVRRDWDDRALRTLAGEVALLADLVRRMAADG